MADDLRDMIGVHFEGLKSFAEIIHCLPKNPKELPDNITELISSVIEHMVDRIENDLNLALDFEAETIGYTMFERDTCTGKFFNAYRKPPEN